MAEKDLIPAYQPQTNVYMDLDGAGDLDAVWHRYRNVNIRPDGIGGFTVGARQGFTSDATNSKNDATTSRGRGMIAWQGYDSVVVDEDKIYYNGGSTALGTGNNPYTDMLASFVQYSQAGVDNLVVVNAGHPSTNASANHGEVWYSADITGAFTRIADIDMPGNDGVSLVRGGCSLNGYLFLGDIFGNIYNSNLDDITTWDAADVIVAEREADIGIYIGKHKDHLVYIGSKSIEFFYDAGSTPNSPLQRREDLFYRIGCVLPNTIIELNDIIYFVGVDPTGNPDIYELKNFQLTVITDDYMKRNLSNADLVPGPLTDLAPLTVVWMMGYVYNPIAGDQLYLTTGDSATYCYTFGSRTWSLASTDNNWTYKGQLTDTTNTLPIVYTNFPLNTRIQFANGAVGTWTAPVGNVGITDLGESTEAASYAFTTPWDKNTDERKRINNIRVLAYRRADSGASYTTSNFSLAWEDLDAEGAGGLTTADFTDTKLLNLNVTQNRVYRCGITRQRIFKFQFDDSGVIYIKGIEVQFDVLRG
jgi:hypothetical protein